MRVNLIFKLVGGKREDRESSKDNDGRYMGEEKRGGEEEKRGGE